MRTWRPCLLALTTVALLVSCGGAAKHHRDDTRVAEPAPPWVSHLEIESGRLCGVGVAGAAFDEDSLYPKMLAEERAVKNLAGVIETVMHEAIIDKSTHRKTTVEMARVLIVDEELIARVADMAETEFWLDVDGVGPFWQKSFTYAHSCIDANVAADELEIDVAAIELGAKKVNVKTAKGVPAWVGRTGTQPGGRLCAVGFSLPTFHPDKTFVIVVEDVRAQVAKVLQTLVSSYYEELTTKSYQLIEEMNVATTQAISKGAVVTDFWYDRDGIGPFRRKRTTYGWGCVYPVDVMLKSVQAVEQQLPDEEKSVIAKVRERAKNAFDELDAEIEKREPSAPTPLPEPDEPPADQTEPEPPADQTEPEPPADQAELEPPVGEPEPEPDLLREEPTATPW